MIAHRSRIGEQDSAYSPLTTFLDPLDNYHSTRALLSPLSDFDSNLAIHQSLTVKGTGQFTMGEGRTDPGFETVDLILFRKVKISSFRTIGDMNPASASGIGEHLNSFGRIPLLAIFLGEHPLESTSRRQ